MTGEYTTHIRFESGALVWHGDARESGVLLIGYDGTLYNSTDLKKELDLTPDTEDTEVILQGYREWGIERLLRRLEGVFSLVLFDREHARLILARDHVGVKPLFFYHTPELFAFSSSLHTLAESDFFEKRLSDTALRDYFTYGFIVQPDTIYADCYKVHSGHFLVYDLRCDTLHEERYWGLGACYDQTKLDLDEASFQQEVAHVLTDAVQRRLVGVQEVGVSLS